MMFKQRWFDKELEAYVNDECLKRLDKSGFIVEAEIVKTITQMGLVDDGTYRASITHEVIPEDLSVRVGSPIGDLNNPKDNPPYPLYLEVGTVKMKAYHPMGTGLQNSRGKLQAVWK